MIDMTRCLRVGDWGVWEVFGSGRQVEGRGAEDDVDGDDGSRDAGAVVLDGILRHRRDQHTERHLIRTNHHTLIHS
jgi:hypothetical protein